METAGNKAVAQAQLLDTLKVERERGITVRSQSVSYVKFAILSRTASEG